jgi:hypothetical protein
MPEEYAIVTSEFEDVCFAGGTRALEKATRCRSRVGIRGISVRGVER